MVPRPSAWREHVKRTNWGDIPSLYAGELDRLWNSWLAQKYQDRTELAAAWRGDLCDHEDAVRGSVRRLRRSEFDGVTAERFRDGVSFYSGIEQRFFGEMKSFLRGELGARQLILGTSDHRAAWSGLPLVLDSTTLDLTDSHSYWREDAWSREGLAYWFDVGNHAVKLAQTALGALTFLRGDVETARETIERRIQRSWVLESVRVSGAGDRHPYWMPSLTGRLALVHRTRIADLDAPALSPGEGEIALSRGKIVSDTGELTWEDIPDDGRVLIDAPRHQVIIGRSGPRATCNLQVDLATPFAAVELASLDARLLSQSERMLLVPGTRLMNTDFVWADDDRQCVASLGHGPTRIEPPVGTLALRGLVGATATSLQALDGHGQPTGERLPFAALGETFCIRFPVEPVVPWYLVEVTRR